MIFIFKFRKIATIVAICLMCNACKSQQQYIIAPGDKHLSYSGRVLMTDTAGHIYWSGTIIELNFEGTDAAVSLKDAHGDNLFYCVIDGRAKTIIKPDSVKRTYNLYDLKPGKHRVQLFKRTECTMGSTAFYGFVFTKKPKCFAPKTYQHSITFYGNSITSGYSLEDEKGDSRDPSYFNNYYTYAAITARNLDARYECISKSGIGFMVSWFPIIMPEMYDRINPDDSGLKWDFKQQSNVVVVDLGQNDSWLINKKEHPQFVARFGNTAPDSTAIVTAYARFIATLRGKYLKSHIVCTLGSMDATKDGSPWPGYIGAAVTQLRDPNISTYFFPYKGTSGHPKRQEQAAMAEGLTRYIKQKMGW